ERDWRFLKGPVVGVVTTSDSAPYGDMDEHGRYSVLPKFLQGADNTNLTAAKGKFTASALTDGMDLFAKQQVRVASESADIQFAAKTKIALNSGGASLEIEGGNMTFHCPGAFKIKAGSFTFVGPDNVPTPLPSLPKSSLKISDPYSSSH
ncbi:DUF2345 domain-containing protein, partial [Paraburkholderia saeva]|uniref:DUF2345 domain-containing protein n=1 Tax=Paraburkholderia saeva TaxID=2777537 RepID=UPI001E2CEFD1